MFCFISSVIVILPRFPNVNHPLSRGIQAGRRFDRRRLRGGGGGVNNTHSCSWRNPRREWIASETQFRAEEKSDAKSANRRKEESIGGPFCALVPKSAYNPPWLTAREGADYVCRPRSPTPSLLAKRTPLGWIFNRLVRLPKNGHVFLSSFSTFKYVFMISRSVHISSKIQNQEPCGPTSLLNRSQAPRG